MALIDVARNGARWVSRPVRRVLNQHVRQRGLILLYHRVCPPQQDVHRLCVRPETFAQHLRVLARHGEPMTLQEMVHRMERGRLGKRAVCLTMDDGYADNLLHAEPILYAAGMSATVFVATHFVEQQREFWWDRLELLVHGAPTTRPLAFVQQGHQVHWPMETPAQRRRAHDAVHALLMNAGVEDRDATLQQLHHWAGVREETRPSHRPMTVEEVRRMEQRGALTGGAHTRFHTRLSSRNAAEQMQDIRSGLEQLQAWVGHPVEFFSYPFGGGGDFDGRSVAIAQGMGFVASLANQVGTVSPHSPRHALPRHVVRDWDAVEFEKRLTRMWGQ